MQRKRGFEMPKRKEGEEPALIVKSVIKAAIHAEGLRCGEEFLDELNVRVARLLTESMERAKHNERSTLRPFDIG